MSREDPQLRIRLPVEVKEKIEISAKANKRSMNAEIVQRLDTSFLKDIHEDDVISAYEAKLLQTMHGMKYQILFSKEPLMKLIRK